MNKEVKIIIAIFTILLTILVVSTILVKIKENQNEKTYSLGDYGVTIDVPKDFSLYENRNDSQILNLQNGKITISVTQLRGDFWASGDILAINDEYIKLISTAMYDRSVKNIEDSKIEINGEELGKVSMELSRNVDSKKTITILTPKSHGYLALEFYGDIDTINKNAENIENIIKTIKFSDNRHNYELDLPKEISPEEEQQSLQSLYELLGLNESGEFVTISGEKEQ